MNWDMVAAIAEIAGAVGVVLSLVYLGRQVSLSNRLAQTEAWRTPISDLNSLNASFAAHVVWWDVRPIAVQLAGDVAIVMLYSEGSWVGTNGEPFNFGSKRLEVFERDGSNWSFLASMVHPTGEINR